MGKLIKLIIIMTTASAAEGTNGSALNCSMNGYTIMVEEIMSLALIALTVANSTFAAILTSMPDLQRSMRLMYRFIKGSADWIGYFIAAVYYIGLDLGYGDIMCKASKYGYIVIYYLNFIIQFGGNA